MKKIVSIAVVTLLLTVVIGGGVHAQTNSAPVLYNQSGTVVNGFDSSANALTPGWYYTQTGTPLYYYANGMYYDPSSQSYGGSILYPTADGPQSLNSGNFISGTGTSTPGVPNTGLGGGALYGWLALIASAGIAVAGTSYLTRSDSKSQS